MVPDKNDCAQAPAVPGLLIPSDWQHKRKEQQSNSDSLNDSEDADFIVVRLHRGWVFNAALASGPQSFSHLRVLRSQLLKVSPGSIWKLNWARRDRTRCVLSARTVALVQASSQCPEGGDRARRFCLSNEITSHSRPVHQKTQRDQCRTAGLQRVAARVKAASVSRSLMENREKSVDFFCCCCFFSDSSNWSKLFCVLSPSYYLQHSNTQLNCGIWNIKPIPIWGIWKWHVFYHPWELKN